MGADFLYVQIAHPKGAILDWDAAEEALGGTTTDRLCEAMDCIHGEASESHEENLAAARGFLTDLQELITDANNPETYPRRDLGWFTLAGHEVYLAAGESWGDAPSEAYSIISNAGWFPDALAAAGFTIESEE